MAAREQLDSALGVSQWRITPLAAVKRVEIEPGAPAWWTSDEEASETFLRAMGVTLP